MVNYYAELGLDPSASPEQLSEQLKKLRATWVKRQSAVANSDNMEKRHEAERMVEYIRKATEILCDPEEKKKYDKQLEKSGAAASAPQNPASDYQAPSAGSTSFMDNAALMDMLESCYENNRYNQAIAAGKRLLDNGVHDLEVYRLLVYSYAEKGDEGQAYRLLGSIDKEFPDDPDAKVLIASVLLRVLPGREMEAKKYIDQLIEGGYGDNSTVAALEIEYQIDADQIDVADQKVASYIAEYGKDEDFCVGVANAYVQAANRNATEYGGDFYFENKRDFNNFADLMDKANNLYEFQGNRQLVIDLKKTTMVPEWWIGVLCFILYGVMAYSISIIGSIACFAAAVLLFTFSRVPNWMLKRYVYKHHLCGFHEVARILNFLFSIWLRIGWGIVKLAFGIAFGL